MATAPDFQDEFKFPDEQTEDTTEKAQSDDSFEIEIEDDLSDENQSANPPIDRQAAEPSDEELSKYSKDVRSRIDKLTKSYHDKRRESERAAKELEAAEDFARKVYEENKRLKEQLSSGSKYLIEQSKSSAEVELESAKKRLKDAYEAGDSDELVAAQQAIADATWKIRQVEHARPIEATPDFELPVRQKVDAKTQEWMENNNTWFGKDDEMTAAALGLDKKLQRQYGSDYVGTDEYFRVIDQTMRKRFPEYFGQETGEPENKSLHSEEEETPRRTKSTTVVAPATRSTPPSRIRLKASQVSIARKLGVTPEEYARQVALLERGN